MRLPKCENRIEFWQKQIEKTNQNNHLKYHLPGEIILYKLNAPQLQY